MKKNKNQHWTTFKDKSFFIFFAKINLIVLGYLFILYALLGAIISPASALETLKNKYLLVAKAALSQLSVTVVGIPGKPIVSASTDCENNQLKIVLSWNQTEDTQFFDIYRDNQPYINGLTQLSWTDTTNLQENQSYTYQVFARGQFSSVGSDPITITTTSCIVTPTPDPKKRPTFNYIFINNRDVNTFVGIPTSKKKNVRFSGIVDPPGSRIKVVVPKKYRMSSTSYANGNGFWTWSNFPFKLKKGNHLIYFSVIDKDDPNNFETYALRFKIGKLKKRLLPKSSGTTVYLTKVNLVPASLETSLKPISLNETAYLGKDFDSKITIKNSKKKAGEKVKIKYRLVDRESKIIQNFAAKETALEQDEDSDALFATASIELPRTIDPGDYRLLTEIEDGGENFITEESPISIKELPMISIGENTNLTYSQLRDNLSSIFVFLSLLFLPLLFFICLEYWFSQRYFPITEIDLKNKKIII